jgi:transglutaminase-like putative cysteine protease
MPVFKIYHTTTYEYDRLVKESVNEIKIYPYQGADQEVLQHEINITGNPDIHTFLDYWGNKTGVFNLLPAHKELSIASKLLVRTTAPSQLRVNFHTGFSDLQADVSGYLQMIEMTTPEKIKSQEIIDGYIDSLQKNENSVAGTVERCCEYVFKHFKYIKGITSVDTTIDEILEHKSGVCQDFVHLMLQMLRTMGIPGQYVSGYICPNKNGMRGEGATHAWVEAWIPGYGWAGIDPTNNVWVTNNHVKLAVGRNFSDCSPVKGSFKGPAVQRLYVYVSIGYEDGKIFEDKNNVQMQPQEDVPPIALPHQAAQQQQ